jgi:hypothetical protein
VQRFFDAVVLGAKPVIDVGDLEYRPPREP